MDDPTELTRPALVALARQRLADPAYLAALHLRAGTGSGEEGDACAVQEVRRVMRDLALERGAAELARYYSPEVDDAPPCVSPICRGLLISVQDAREGWRVECHGLLRLLPGSLPEGSAGEALELRRGYRLFDWSARAALPPLAEVLAEVLKAGAKGTEREAAAVGVAAKLRDHAVELRALPTIVDDLTRRGAAKTLRALARDLDLDLARALDLALALALARALARDRALALDLARDRALALARDRALALDLDVGAPPETVAALPSPVALLRELLEMEGA